VKEPPRVTIRRRELHRELSQVLGESQAARFIAALRGPLHDYRERCDAKQSVAVFQKDLKRLKSTFAAFERAFYSSSEETQDSLRGAFDFDDAFVLIRLELNYRLTDRFRRGRPAAVARRFLARDLAEILRSLGVPLRKSRQGKLARTLAIVLAALGDSLPSDPFDVVTQAIEDLESRDSKARRVSTEKQAEQITSHKTN
jgi:hypothetical protein